MTIIYTEKAIALIDNIIVVFSKKIFSYNYEARDYVERIKDEVNNSVSILGTSLPKAGKKYQLTKYGKPTHFVRYKSNSQTTWYILIRITEDRALVTYIHNNHDKIHSIAKAKR